MVVGLLTAANGEQDGTRSGKPQANNKETGGAVSHSAIETNLRISAGLDYVAASGDGEDVRAHYLWTVQQMTHAVPLEELTTAELVSLVAILIPAHSRIVGGEVGGPPATVLRLIPSSDDGGMASGS